jgi:tricorn protease-like protein
VHTTPTARGFVAKYKAANKALYKLYATSIAPTTATNIPYNTVSKALFCPLQGSKTPPLRKVASRV